MKLQFAYLALAIAASAVSLGNATPCGGVVSFTLIDAETGQPFGEVYPVDQATDRVDITTPFLSGDLVKYSVQANTVDCDSGRIGSVELCVGGSCRCERSAPYSLFGDSSRGFSGSAFLEGMYEITATPFASANCRGDHLSGTKTLTFSVSDAMEPSNAEMLSLVLRCAPFIIFFKEAPSTLPEYDVDTDFNYYFFSDMMNEASGIPPSFLASGVRNAKTDFPVDFEQYFIDDAEVCTSFFAPAVKVITEPWITPATTTILETRKTCITNENDELYMLGCFNFHDDIELGITSFRAIPRLPAALEPLPRVPLTWYTQAFQQLPFAMRLYSDSQMTDLLSQNTLAEIDFVSDEDLAAALNQVQGAGDPGKFQAFHVGGSDYRLWIWSVSLPEGENVWAVAYRPRNVPVPQLVKESLSLEP